jgi:hypothetical protein
MELQATPQTRYQAIKALEQHIIDIGKGKVRLGLKPHELDDYIADQYRMLKTLRAQGLRI